MPKIKETIVDDLALMTAQEFERVNANIAKLDTKIYTRIGEVNTRIDKIHDHLIAFEANNERHFVHIERSLKAIATSVAGHERRISRLETKLA